MKNKRRYYYCSFFLNNRRLGGGYIPEGSTADERNFVAKKSGIMHHNAIVFHDRGIYLKFRKRNYGVQIIRKESDGVFVFSK